MSSELLVSLYEQSSPDVRRRGRRWYPTLRRRLLTLAEEHDRSLAQVAAVLAITSVDAQLKTNLRWTREILNGERAAGRYPSWQTPKVRAALEARYPCRYVTGPKVHAFYRAVMGDPDALVLDRWMLLPVVGRERRRKDIGVRLRREVDAAYREAALTCEERVRNFQAIVWIHLRETTPTKAGRVPRLADITDISGI